MNIPRFTAEASLFSSVKGYPILGMPSISGGASEVVPCLDWGTCLRSCQNSWYDCIRGCQWWEWMIGSCVPKCRAGWVTCLANC
jgi:hypothetical protein